MMDVLLYLPLLSEQTPVLEHTFQARKWLVVTRFSAAGHGRETGLS